LDQKEIVYAASSHIDYDGDMTTESLLFAIDATTGQPVPEWRDFADFQAFGPGGAPVSPYLTRGDLDEGDLSQPTEDGGTIYFGSTSGTFYAYRRDRSGEAEPGSVKWTYRDTSLLGLEPKFTTAPILDRNIERVLVTANHNNGTADPSDDRGVLYSLKIGTAIDETAFAWKKTFPAAIPGAPVSWKAPQSLGIRSVWIGYGGPDLTGVAALDSAGQFLAPSPPSWVRAYPSGNQYWLGLDSQGRDIFSQVIWGSRIALLVGFLSAFFTVVLGVIVGLIAGYAGGKTEAILMRFTDVILVLPGLPLIITLSAVLGASIWNIILVISLLGWPGIARIIRAEVLSLKERPFIDSARVTGASATRIVFKHIAPNVMPLAFLYMTFSVSGAILTEAALSFIGLGDINTMSWGIMLQLVSQSKALTAWWWLLPPGLAITLISLAFFLVGRAFDEIVNPRLRKR
jgi:peptide/nickel transport system permease protein